ncbi:hypothetical protein ACE1CI_14665 [Aerosakkonemataceae cyanobacterium BLCC-F50]|uniref:Uncharacterized protein n=1 Tax=Floridaenema flaviceps BLCC-F50 TaxID=3153642 RepID=A0ABV4XR19_9CYAN
MEPITDEYLKAITLILERHEIISVLLVLGNFVAEGLDKKQISVDDFISWEKLLDKLLTAAEVPIKAQVFLRNLDAVVEILAQ